MTTKKTKHSDDAIEEMAVRFSIWLRAVRTGDSGVAKHAERELNKQMKRDGYLLAKSGVKQCS